MTKEDKQIIYRAEKENWRIGGRTRLKRSLVKRLLEKNLTLYRENVEFENKIADIKANCDLAIEGRDVKIKELELELTVEKDQHQEEINLHLHAEDYIKSLEEENNKLLDVINGQDVKIADLEKENAELKSEKGCETCTKFDEVKLTIAKDIIQQFLIQNPISDWLIEKANKFIKEIEK